MSPSRNRRSPWGRILFGFFFVLLAGCATARRDRVFFEHPAPVPSISGMSYDGRNLWITSDGSGSVFEVDPDTWKTLRVVPAPTKATGGSAWDGESLWQLGYEDHRIYELDLVTGRVLNELNTPGDGMCSGLTYDGKDLWVLNFEDRKIYKISVAEHGRILASFDGYYEATGVAWDGESIWHGLLVGTSTIGQPMPYTGFVQNLDAATGRILDVYHIPGVGAGTSDWIPGTRGRAKRFWWYDGFYDRIIEVREPARSRAKLAAPAPSSSPADR